MRYVKNVQLIVALENWKWIVKIKPFEMEQKTAIELFNTKSNLIISNKENENVINLLRTRIKEKQPEVFEKLSAVFDNQFLHQFLAANFWDFDKAYSYVESYIYYRFTSYPEVIERFPNIQLKMLESKHVSLLKYRDEEDALVIVTRAKFWDPAQNPVDDFITQGTILCELGFRMDENLPKTGAVIILDSADLTYWQSSYITPSAIIKGFNLIVNSLPIFPKAIHVIGGGMIVGMMYAALYPVVKPLIGDKIFMHYGDLSTLHEKVPRNILPISLGGILQEEDAIEHGICDMMNALIDEGFGGYKEN